MRYLLIALLFLTSKTYADELLEPGQCVDANNLPYEIVERLTDHAYEIMAEMGPGGIHKLLVTKRAIYTTTGHLTGIKVKAGKTYTVPMENGFTEQVGSYIECGVVPYPKQVFGPSMAFRNRIKGVDGK